MKDSLLSYQKVLLSPFLVIAFLNLFTLLLIFIVFYSFFAIPTGYEIQMPIMASTGFEEKGFVSIRISAENVLFFNDRVVTLNDLKRILLKSNITNNTVYVQADNRASMARVADIWEMCKGLGIVKVKVSTF